MHEHAEHGVAAHWAYKEAGTRATRAFAASAKYDAKIAVLRQLLAWETTCDASSAGGAARWAAAARPRFDDRIYVFTPQARVVELPQGATPVDFAYTCTPTSAIAAAARASTARWCR